MITGDHPATALAIATNLGISLPGDQHLTGTQLKELEVMDLADEIGRISLFARVSPEDKIKIVQALQNRGQVVAMTGDGVNDAPALRGADIGVAMGITGTDVSKEASDMVLLDDNFATIVAAVAEGRRIYDNIRKFVRYMLGTNFGEVATMFGGIMLNLPLPLLPIQILWINLVTDSLPALALSNEPAEPNIMSRPPRPAGESLFAHGLWLQVLWSGLLMAAGCLWMFSWAIERHLALGQSRSEAETAARTMVFMTMAFYQLFNALAIRSDRRSVFSLNPSGNWYLYGAVLITALLQLGAVYLPFLQPIFKTIPVGGADLLVSAAISATILLAVELEKALLRMIRR
jgi:Ca2+-transporting ATPase